MDILIPTFNTTTKNVYYFWNVANAQKVIEKEKMKISFTS